MQQDVKVILTAEDNTSGALQAAQGGVTGLTGTVKKFAAAAGVAFATKKIVDFGIASVKAFSEAEAAQARMAQILKEGVVKATDAQVEALQEQAEALERVGVVGKEAILVGQGQLASFDLQAESIQKLIPSILNYAVAERGANLSGEELKAVTNGLAQALQGNFASLTKTGFILDENTKKMISEGNEVERVAALVSVLDSTYSGLNERMRTTTEGSIVGMQFAFENLKESLGEVLSESLTPFILKLTEFISKPEFIMFVQTLAHMFGTVLKVAIWAVSGAFNELVHQWENFFKFIDKIEETFNRIRNAAQRAASAVSSVVSGVSSKLFGGGKADGGPVSGGSAYLVGERGPEIFQPKVAGNIIPNHALASGGSVVINITGNTLLDDFAGDKIANQIMRAIKGNLRV